MKEICQDSVVLQSCENSLLKYRIFYQADPWACCLWVNITRWGVSCRCETTNSFSELIVSMCLARKALFWSFEIGLWAANMQDRSRRDDRNKVIFTSVWNKQQSWSLIDLDAQYLTVRWKIMSKSLPFLSMFTVKWLSLIYYKAAGSEIAFGYMLWCSLSLPEWWIQHQR